MTRILERLDPSNLDGKGTALLWHSCHNQLWTPFSSLPHANYRHIALISTEFLMLLVEPADSCFYW